MDKDHGLVFQVHPSMHAGKEDKSHPEVNGMSRQVWIIKVLE